MPCLLVWSGLPWWGSHEEPGATVNRVRLSAINSLAFDSRHLTLDNRLSGIRLSAIHSRQSTLGNQLLGIRLSAIDTRQSAPSFSVRLPASEYPAIHNRLLALDSRNVVYVMVPTRLYHDGWVCG
ncbi:hypothetical protein BDB00DRAFT_877025 [Zychaea mexicana]|uniref:uncharacterized protein n=1 Tax=Zychaea mexicana TaxID=64656 RepID=UPI0022FEE4B6|nr:uncharacterized protein BDB00DRAFT_877025 [Zychaea mexicana]KAI9488857.1 hypothetical protein BDB00DRAFT_877025 [Zychaea mexicana]